MKKAQKRGIIALIIILAIVMVFMAVKSFATDSKYLNITGEREGNETYIVTAVKGVDGFTPKTIWKIVSFDSMKESDKAKYDEAIYCINPERGFGSERTAGNDRKEYNFSFNMKDLSGLEQKYKDMFADQTKYNSILWILDNCYLPKQTPEADRRNAKASLLASAEIDRDLLTDNDIEVVQQMAIWYFSSEQAGYHYEPANFPSIALNDTQLDQLLAENGIDKDPRRYNDMKKLYEYFITSAKANSGSYGTADKREVNVPKVTFATPKNNESITTIETISGVECFIAGPYKITDANHAGLTYTLQGKVTDQSGKTIDEYELLNSEKKSDETLQLDKTILGKEFYIAIPTTNKGVTKIKLNMSTSYITTTTTCWTHSEKYATEQPVVIIEKTPHKDEIDVEVQVKRPEFDLALRKFITKVNNTEITSRLPQVDVTKLVDGSSTTATYTHTKNPVSVKTGDLVTYTIRVYNEGEMSGYAAEITDDIPEGLKFVVNNPINIEYMWKLSKDEKSITTNYLSMEKDEKNLIAAFDSSSMKSPAFKDVKVVFEVTEPNTSTRILRNIAQISNDTDANGEEVEDRDSLPGSLKPEDLTPEKYTPEKYKDNSTYVEDDDDYEPLKLEYFDLSLRKFITKINSTNITSRIPQVDVSKLVDGSATTATYTHTKEALGVKTGDTVTYTIRIYNEGQIDGTATEITDTIPNGLKFIPASKSSINKQYGWEVSQDGKTISTKYLENAIIKAFDKTSEKKQLDYKDVLVEFEVTEPNTSERILRNIAEITDDTGDDIDSKPGSSMDHTDKYEYHDENSDYEEDDDDYEQIKLQYFDLSLRKFITKVNTENVATRIPKVTLDKDGKLVYTHTKEPVLVANNDVVTYTIRVYNEGKIAGYAKEVTDDIPQGLSYLPEHETNKEYGWKLSEDGKSISTDYLSKEKSDERKEDNLLKAFDKSKGITKENPDYRDLKVAFKVTETNLATDRIIINTAEITDDSDENEKPINDQDSIPANNKEDEDDIDKEYLRVKYFDLSLLKWVSKTYVTENGKTTVTNTGHTGLENPEPIVKVDLDRKNINNVTVKFGYTIKITNEGEIEGYAKEISDYIPAGLKFIKADNPDWTEKDGKIVTKKLANTLLKPGESATVEVILTWINDGDNMGVKTNVAEISEDYNKHGSKDIDSIPNNKKDGEDDIDDAPVMLTIKTGEGPTYIILGIVAFAMLFTGISLIKKYVLT